MSVWLPATGAWSVVLFTDDDARLQELAALRPHLTGVRFVAVSPRAMDAPPDVALLIDQDARLATSFGVRGTRAFMIDGRGAVRNAWDGVPAREALAGWAARPAVTVDAPPGLYALLGTVVVLAAMGLWASRPGPSVEQVSTAAAAPAQVVQAAANGTSAAPSPEAPPAAAGTAPKRGPANVFGDWIVVPRERAPQLAALDGAGVLTVRADAEHEVTACRSFVQVAGPLSLSAEWSVEGISGRPAILKYRQFDAAGQPVKSAAALTIVARSKGTGGWAPAAATVTPVGKGTQGRLCVDLAAGAGTVQVRNVSP